MLIVEGMKAYWTAAGLGRTGTLGPWDLGWPLEDANGIPGRKPGNLEALWDYEKGIGRWGLGDDRNAMKWYENGMESAI